MLLAFFVSMEILWIWHLNHLLLIGMCILTSALRRSIPLNTGYFSRTSAISWPDSYHWRRRHSDRGFPLIIHIKAQTIWYNVPLSFSVVVVFSRLLQYTASESLARLGRSSSILSFSLRHFYNYFGATFRRMFQLCQQVTFEVSNLVALTEASQSRWGHASAFFPQVLFNRRNLPLPLFPLEINNTKIIIWICQIQM